MLWLVLIISVAPSLAALAYLALVNPTRRRRNNNKATPARASYIGLAIVALAGVAVLLGMTFGAFLIWLAWAGVGGWAITNIFRISKAPAAKRRASKAAQASAPTNRPVGTGPDALPIDSVGTGA